MTLQHLLDKQAISELVVGYAHAMDRQDAAAFERLFTADAQLNLGVFTAPASALIGAMRQGIPSPYTVMHHLVTNILITLDGDTARAVTYVHVVHRRVQDGRTWDEEMRGRYLDRFLRTEVGWRFTERTLVYDWSRVEPYDGADYWDKPGATPLLGSVGETDPAWGFLA